MDEVRKAQIQAHAQAIVALLYEETDPEQVQTLLGIEETVRQHILEHVSPEIGIFYPSKQRHDEWSHSTHPKHPWTVEPQREAESATRCQSLHPLES